MQYSESVISQNTRFAYKNRRMLNVNKIGVVRYKSVKVATLVQVSNIYWTVHHCNS